MSWQTILMVILIPLIAYSVILWLGVIMWTYNDIRERTRDSWSRWVSVLLVVLFNFPGLVLYLVLRPKETLADAYERRIEAEALMRDLPEERPSCTRCGRTVKESFRLCPYCRTVLRQECKTCNQLLELTWVACPYCGAEGPQAASAVTPRPAPAAAPPPPSPAPASPPPAPATAEARTQPRPQS
jgi:RNA polymerase subunit RPABC4/transcription elongation factor Spt4